MWVRPVVGDRPGATDRNAPALDGSSGPIDPPLFLGLTELKTPNARAPNGESVVPAVIHEKSEHARYITRDSCRLRALSGGRKATSPEQ